MKLFVGLGNPGIKYVHNRHNIGFQCLDFYLSQEAFKGNSFKQDASFKADFIKINDLVFAKPQTFMNRSGESVQRLMQFFKITPENVYIFFDDLDIPLGQLKVTKKGPQIHNGISSITQKIGDDYYKVRLGVDNRDPGRRTPGETYVLQDFTKEELKLTPGMFEEAARRIGLELK